MIPSPTPTPEDQARMKEVDKLTNRMGALQFMLSRLGFTDYQFDEEDINRERQRMPEGDDFMEFRVPAAVNKQEAKQQEPQTDYIEFDLGFEPFNPDSVEEAPEQASLKTGAVPSVTAQAQPSQALPTSLGDLGIQGLDQATTAMNSPLAPPVAAPLPVPAPLQMPNPPIMDPTKVGIPTEITGIE